MCFPYVLHSSISSIVFYTCLIVMSHKTFKILMETNVFIFSLMILGFLCCLRFFFTDITVLLKKTSSKFLTCISLTLLEFIWIWHDSIFYLLYSQLNQDHLSNKLFFYHWLLCHLCFILGSTCRFYYRQLNYLFAWAIKVVVKLQTLQYRSFTVS